MRLRILRRAQGDLFEIRDYVARDSPDAADKLTDELLARIEGLVSHPETGVVPRDPRLKLLGYRCLIHRRYLVFYKVMRAQVKIYRVLHGNRAYAHLL